MALQKTFTRSDGTTGNYIRLVNASLPYYDRDKGVSNGFLGFNVYVDEDAAKVSNKAIFMTLSVKLTLDLLSKLTLDGTWDTFAESVYKNKEAISELKDAEDIIDTTETT